MVSGMGIRRADQLPAGHVALTVFYGPGDDAGTDYFGPILEEDALTIRIEVYGEPMKTFRKRDCTITRSAEDTRGAV